MKLKCSSALLSGVGLGMPNNYPWFNRHLTKMAKAHGWQRNTNTVQGTDAS